MPGKKATGRPFDSAPVAPGLSVVTFARWKTDDLLDLALYSALPIIDEQPAADTDLEEPEAKLGHRHRVLLIGPRLEIGDGHRPGRQLIKLFSVFDLR